MVSGAHEPPKCNLLGYTISTTAKCSGVPKTGVAKFPMTPDAADSGMYYQLLCTIRVLSNNEYAVSNTEMLFFFCCMVTHIVHVVMKIQTFL